MRTILLGLCALTLFAGLTQKTAAQTVIAALGPPMADADWVWSDEYQCWLWNGPEFQGDYQGHSFFKAHFLNHQFSTVGLARDDIGPGRNRARADAHFQSSGRDVIRPADPVRILG
jgi:hypothetical protein